MLLLCRLQPFISSTDLANFAINSFPMDSEGDQVESLKARLAAETARAAALEEELDLLAFENLQLRNQIQDLRIAARSVEHEAPPPPSAEGSVLGSGAVPVPAVAPVPDYGDLLVDGDGAFARVPVHQFKEVCGGMNALASKYLVVDGRDVAVCGGVDKTLRGVAVNTGEVLFSKSFTAPVLCIACFHHTIACGLMDGSFAIVCTVVFTIFDVLLLISHLICVDRLCWTPVPVPAAGSARIKCGP